LAWNIKARLKKITAAEKGLPVKDPGGRLKVALIWPGSYRSGMSSLGFQSIYGLLNARPEVLAERFFWPEGPLAREYERSRSPLLSLESGRPLGEFDLLAASLMLENDYWRLPAILEKSGLSARALERAEGDPPLLVGGVAVWANPWPVIPFVDLVLTGEAEAQWPQLISAWETIRFKPLPKPELMALLSRSTPGSLHPGLMADFPTPSSREVRDFFPVRPARLVWPDNWRAGPEAPLEPGKKILPPVSPILSPQAEFADTRLVEISRGCPYGCRFCLAGFLYRPHRLWPMKDILTALGPPEKPGEKVGLVSPAPADHPDLAALLAVLFEQRRSVTLSSLRLSALGPELAAQLAAGRLYGAAVAPEGGSQRLRNIINKDLDEETILAGTRLLAEAGLKKIKLYFMVGLPGEDEGDLAELIELCRKIRRAASRGSSWPELQVSLANFTPKAQTPFEVAPMLTAAEFRRRGRLISQALRNVPRLSVNLDPPLWSIAQGLLARGGPESSALVTALARRQGRLKASLAEIGYDDRHPIHRPWPPDKPHPWRVVEPAPGFETFTREAERAGRGLISPACLPAGNCGACRACPGSAVA
jgi:radical SAM superfamily enzyme YgiQ (UPF0313 family)